MRANSSTRVSEGPRSSASRWWVDMRPSVSRQVVQFVQLPPQQEICNGLAAAIVYPTQDGDGNDSACESDDRICREPLLRRGGAAHKGVARIGMASIFSFML